MNDRSSWAWSVSVVGGALLWLITAGLTGRREAWDASLYWVVAYPLSIILAGAVAYRVPHRPWRWGLAVMLAQAMVLVFSGSDFGLLPLGLIMFSILALPAIVLAKLAAWLRLRSEQV